MTTCRLYATAYRDFGTGAHIIELLTELDLLVAICAGWLIAWEEKPK